MFDIPRQLPSYDELQLTPALENGEHQPAIRCEGDRLRVDFLAHVVMDLRTYERLMRADFPPIYPCLQQSSAAASATAHLSTTPDLEP